MKIFRNKYGEIRSGYKIITVLFIALLLQAIVGIFISVLVNRSLFVSFMTNEINTIITLISELILIFIPILFWVSLENKSIGKMGLTDLKRSYRELIIGLALGAVTISISAVVLIAFNEVEIKYTSTGIETIKNLIYSLILYISVGFAEEILCRGYIMSTLKRTRNKYAVIVISSLIFAAMHLGNYGITPLAFFNLALVGALFGYMFMKSKNIWMCIGYHITWNYFQGAVWGFSVSGTGKKGICTITNLGENFINGGSFGAEGGIVVTIVTCLAFIFVYMYYKDKNLDEFLNMD